MASTLGDVPIECTSQLVKQGQYSIPVIRLKVIIQFARKNTLSLPRLCLFDTGAPLSIIPYKIHHGRALDWEKIPDSSPGKKPWYGDWLGVPCDLGRIRVWLPAPNKPTRGPFYLIGKFPQGTPDQFKNQKGKKKKVN